MGRADVGKGRVDAGAKAAMKDYHVLIMSDGTGETAYQTLKAAMAQFKEDVLITRYGKVREEPQIEEILKAVSVRPTLVICTFVSSQLREALVGSAARYGVECVDMLGPVIDKLADFFKQTPSAQPGILHEVDDTYFDRIDAIEYAIQHDNGRSLNDLETAQIILVGLSRTSKTPLSLYLAQEGWKVANVPLVLDVKPPKEMFAADQHKIAALTIDPHRLAEIRRARLEQLGQQDRRAYGDLNRIREELDYAEEVFAENPEWPIIDVTGKSLEEVSQEVLDRLIGRGRRL